MNAGGVLFSDAFWREGNGGLVCCSRGAVVGRAGAFLRRGAFHLEHDAGGRVLVLEVAGGCCAVESVLRIQTHFNSFTI